MKFDLRDYQREALDGVSRCLSEHETTAVILATGLGKTVTLAYEIKEYLTAHPGERVIVLVHRKELVDQTIKKLAEVAPELSTGVVKGGVRQVDRRVIVASVATLGRDTIKAKLLRESITGVGRIIVDECHHAAAPTYRTVLDHYGVKATGYTATFMRADGKSLTEVWQSIAIERDILWGVRNGHLIMPRGKRVVIPDLHLASRRGDWTDDQVADALADSFAPELVVKAWREHAFDRKTVGFFPTVRSARIFQDAFRDAGVECELIHEGTRDRKAVYRWHRPGTVLLNCMVLTEGYDDPTIDCVLQGRPTKNAGLYRQMVGRGLRPDLDSGVSIADQDCLILNVTAIDMPALCGIPSLADETMGKPDADGVTLLDLTLELDAGDELDEEDPAYSGPVDVVDFEALAGYSSKRWIKTIGGNSVLPVGLGAFVFLIPAGGRYDVAWCSRYVTAPVKFQGVKRAGGRTDHLGLPYGLAAQAAEELAVVLAAVTGGVRSLSRTGAWRAGPPSKAALLEAINAAVHYPPNVTAGELSDLTDTVIASRRVDALVAKMREARLV